MTFSLNALTLLKILPLLFLKLEKGEGDGDKIKKRDPRVVDHQEIVCSFATKVSTDASVGLANEGSGTSDTIHESPATDNFALIRSRPTYSKDGLDAMLENGPWFIRNNPYNEKVESGCELTKKDVGNVPLSFNFMVSGYSRAMIELRAKEELKDTIVVAMLKLVGEGFNMCTIRDEYE
nr:hypothetical protein [Tanacetum cinerariifolium]